jgi:hypothetical protein
MLGLTALRGGRTVASTGLKQFQPPSGRLVLHLKRKTWPNKLTFITDQPKVTLADPGSPLSKTITLSATASAIAGRTITSVRFEYVPSGGTTWTPIATVTAAPFTTQLDTTKLADGAYDFRAVATDNTSQTGSSVRTARLVQNGGLR